MSNFVKEFFIMTKPRVWTFLLITGIAGEVFSLGIKRSFDVEGFIFVSVYITLGLMGAESLSNYFDIDIDRKMSRTKERALPSGKMKPSVALYGGIIMIALTLLLSFFMSFLSFLFMATGIFDYDIVYALLSKKRTSLNIILGAYSGGAPLLAGFYAFTSTFNLLALLLFLVILAWTPLHIWSLSIRYKKDYEEAEVPMLPVRRTTKQTMRVLFPVALLTSLVTILTGIEFQTYFPLYLGLAVVVMYLLLGIFLFVSYLRALIDPEKRIMKLFGSTNMFVGIFFILVAILSIIIPFAGVR